MRIIKLHIQNYKNLSNVEMDFSHSNGKTLITGNNGTGKSNVIEVLSAIFYALYHKSKNVEPDYFRFDIEYEIGSRSAYPRKYPYGYGPHKIHICNVDGVIELKANGEVIKKDEWAEYLPKRVVSVYSGEEKRLWEQYYFKEYDEFNKQYIKQKKAIEYQKMVYINKYYWDLTLSLLEISDMDDHKSFLKNQLNINTIEGVGCLFNLNNVRENKNIVAQKILDYINPEKKQNVFIPLDNLKKLYDIVGYEEDIFFNLAVLLLYKDYKIIASFNVMFNKGLTTKLLSEGEKKLLLIYGALNLFSGECLFLFDEPDAHLHEKRKSEVYDLIMKCENSQIIVTSHSPKMIRLFPYDNQIVLRKSENGDLEAITAHGFEEFKDILDTDITFEEEFAIRESRMPLLLVEGKTDKKHIATAWEKLYPGEKMPFSIVSLNCADKIRQYILSVPDKFAKSVIIGLVDNDSAGQKVVTGCQKICENVYKYSIDQRQGQTRQAYCIVLPFVDGNVKIFNYCPIEFLYDINILLENDVLEKIDYNEAISKWVIKGQNAIKREEYPDCVEKCFYRVSDSIKNRFSEKVIELEEKDFEEFRKVFDLIKRVLEENDQKE